jgi:translation initiation factor IF-1
VIKKILPDSRFTVYCEKMDKDVLCYLSGKLKRGPKPAEHDEVKFEIDISNPDLGRISDVRR